MNTAATVKIGPAAAALLAAGIGSFTVALMTILGENVKSVGSALNWYAPVGALSGKTGVAIIVWLASWALLRWWWREEEPAFQTVLAISLVLIALGFLGTFPPVFDMF